ncbi:uncharacterized protein PAC_15323 [Phialocephala subalpina]|uniref:Uncharacterized protein n=1 Tax=Phialocephala subalpina TaxID=576137 RepID=A0A1L7XK90_9HELO|nr:uncharacterized protein PAC_15323 [Phialocephala subalpina]
MEMVQRDDTDYISIHFSLDEQKSKCNPTPQQKAVYNFHEARHSNEAEDIYASTWFERTEGFMEHARPDNQNTVLTSWTMVEDLAFGEFFLAHPVAGYSLWQFLHACYELDEVVCGPSQIGFWMSLKPFMYMETEEIKKEWERSLRRLKREIDREDLEGENLLRKMYTLDCGVEKLDNTFEALEGGFLGNLEGKKFADQMMKTICTAYDWRRHILTRLSVAEASQTNDEFSDGGDIASSRDSKRKGRNRSRGRNKTSGKKNKKRRVSARKKELEEAKLLRSHTVSPHPTAWSPSQVYVSVLVIALAWALYDNIKRRI